MSFPTHWLALGSVKCFCFTKHFANYYLMVVGRTYRPITQQSRFKGNSQNHNLINIKLD